MRQPDRFIHSVRRNDDKTRRGKYRGTRVDQLLQEHFERTCLVYYTVLYYLNHLLHTTRHDDGDLLMGHGGTTLNH